MLLCKLFLVIIVLEQVSAQVCNETISVFREVSETYTYTYYEAYQGTDCLIWCTKSRLAVNVKTRQVKKLVDVTVNVCCEGYIEDDSHEGDSLKCVPLCNPECRNGYCRNPNECACEPGYAIDPNDILNGCVPLCLEGCSTPGCLSTCSEEYHDTGETDMCYGTCLNGTCVAPGVCLCDPGYMRLLEVCEPVCSGCEHGKCVAPGQCKCDFGWRQKCGSCEPDCSGCEHGKCMAPGQCVCDYGYKAENAKCVPHCSNCVDGNCIAPGVCVCDRGWYLAEDGSKCKAHCDVACGNGSCVAPNHCEYYSGIEEQQERENISYELYGASTAPLCLPKCNNCDEIYVSPYICSCEAHYETIYTTTDGNKCDCFDCSDASRKCERTTCKKKSNEENVEGINESKLAADPKQIPISIVNTTHTGSTNLHYNTSCTPLKSDRFTYHWIYAGIILFELLVIICMLVILEKKHLLSRLITNKFVPQDKPRAEVAVHYTSSVTCSKMKETTESESS